jgi:glycosyltransferase involved in cell wall biosynthesis
LKLDREPQSVNILLVSPFHGSSSHAAWANGFKTHSRHSVSIVELADQAWAWRLKGGSVPLWQELRHWNKPTDLIMATSLTCLASLHGLLRRSPLAGLPTVYYMHENQLTYPIRPGGKRDSQLVLRQFHAQLAADEIWFNSAYNKDSWFRKLPGFLANFKDHHGLELLSELEERSKVVPLGLCLGDTPLPSGDRKRPILLWNQRWAWEKGVDRLVSLIKKFGPQADFDVVLLGPSSQDAVRLELEDFLGPRLLHSGWCSRDSYLDWVGKASVTVSVARHEFFGISLLEAASRGLMLFVPNGLAYPEVLPAELHSTCLYSSTKDLYRRLKGFLAAPKEFDSIRRELREAALNYDWKRQATNYDSELERVLSACEGS